MADLRTEYLGYRLRSPLVPSSSPVTGDLDSLRRLEDAGAGAVVLPSLFEERLGREAREAQRAGSLAASTYSRPTRPSPPAGPYSLGSEGYLRFAAQAKASVSVPVIASLNGVSSSGWGWYAAELDATGVDALELNMHDVITAPTTAASEVEARYVEIVRTVRAATSVPIAAKLGMSFTALPNLAARLVEAGATGLVLFNRFFDPDIDLESGRLVSQLQLSDPRELGARLRWLGILRPQVQASLAATGGAHSGTDVVKALLAGADAVMMASALLQHGAGYLATVEAEVIQLMEAHGYEAVDELRGAMSRPRVADPSAYERSVYEETLASFESRPTATRQ